MIVILSFALLPLGLVAVLQTERAVEAAEDAYRTSLSARTADIARPEREAIFLTFGLARALSAQLEGGIPPVDMCRSLMERVARTTPDVLFLGYHAGQLSCTVEMNRVPWSGRSSRNLKWLFSLF